MARSGPGYGKLGGNRRSGSAAWQWIVIGGVLGLGCSAVMVLSLLTLGVLNIEGVATEVAIENTPIPPPIVDIQGTVDAIVGTTIAEQPAAQQPVSPATDEPTQQQEGVVVAPTATPPVTSTSEPEPTEEEATEDILPDSSDQPNVTTQDTSQGLAPSGTGQSDIPIELQPLISTTRRVDAGTFLMGTSPREVARAVDECINRDGGACETAMGADSTPAHEVTLDTFLIEITEVTNQQYVAFLNSTLMGPNSHLNECFGQLCVDTNVENPDVSVIIFDSQNYDIDPIFANQPVVGVTWFGARAYCEAIGRRLPTEAEWERAARGADNFIYPWGDIWDDTYARTRTLVEGDVGVVDVRSFPALSASTWGAFDMAGNAAEWVWDFYSPTYYSQPAALGLNPMGPPSGTERAVRGGSWDTPPFFSRSVHRQSLRPNETALWLGFRCAEDFSPTGVNEVDLGGSNEGILEGDPTEEPIDAAPTLEPLPLPTTDAGEAETTEVPVVPPGG